MSAASEANAHAAAQKAGVTRDKLLPIFTLMEKSGGGFASRLASAWFHADGGNQLRIQEAFPELIRDYTEQYEAGHR